MSQTDLDINRSVRSIFVKHWIDLGRISIRSSDGKLWIHGTLSRIAGMSEELTVPIVESMFNDIDRIKNLVRVNVALENWTKDSGSWHLVGRASSKDLQKIAEPGQGIYNLGYKEK